VGTPIANRTRAELEGVIGCFINTLVLRTDLSGTPSLRQILQQVKQTALQAYAHQDVPFELLVEELQPQRDLSRNPFFQVMFVLQNAPLPPMRLSDLTVETLSLPVQTAKFDLTLLLWETAEGVEGYFEYDRDLFEEATIRRLVSHLQRVLQAMVADPDQRISQVQLLSQAEREQILMSWNQTAVPYPQQSCTHQLFEAQVASHPDAVAVVCGQDRLTYRQLDCKANQLARYLQGLGVGPNVLVALCMERSVEMIIGLLGVLKAGGAYVPLDPSAPKERLEFLLADIHAPALLTQSWLVKRFPESTCSVLCLDTAQESLACESDEAVASDVEAQNLAYVLYTSGSTGQPKGVLISHQNLVHSTSARLAYYEEAVSGFLLLSPYYFDSSVAGIFWTLCQGGTLCLPQEGFQMDLTQLATVISQERISHLLMLPSLYQLLLTEVDIQQLSSLSTIIVAGEACSLELVKRHAELLSSVSLYNEYGPTEGTVWSSVYQCQEKEPRQTIPIGRPISNVQLYLLNSFMQPVPIGEVGEIYIGGAGLAQGYLNRPDLAAASFIPNPFSEQAGARLYKSGDLARYLSDGNLEFIGRSDQQVKIRGYRIELGEIEEALSRHPQVQEVAVLAREDRTRDKQLVAYVVARQAEVTEEVLRSFLREHVPSYMIPAVFVWMEALPLTSNGKLDRRALPAPSHQRTELQQAYEPASTALQEQLVQIWQEVLDRETIGIQDNFFDLGGHSLKATQVMSRVQQVLGVKVPLRSVFEEPTIAGLARAIEQEKKRSEEGDQTPIQSSSRGEKQLEDLLAYVEDLSEQDLQILLEASLSGSDAN